MFAIELVAIHGIKKSELDKAHDAAGDNDREIIVNSDSYTMIVALGTEGYDDRTPDGY